MHFNLKTLFAATAVAGVALYLLVPAPSYVAVPLLVMLDLGLAALVLAGLVYGSGALRAFCLGAMVPAGGTMVAYTWMLGLWLTAGPWEVESRGEIVRYLEEFVLTVRVSSVYLWVLYLVIGLVTVAARRVILGRGPASRLPHRADDSQSPQ
jgi:hypothetical protein